MNEDQLRWYLRRLGRMSAKEMAWRGVDHARRVVWSRHQVTPDALGDRPADDGPLPADRPLFGRARPLSVIAGARHVPARRRGPFRFTATLPLGALEQVPASVRAAVIRDAEAILAGRWQVLSVARPDIAAPDWFYDPLTGTRAPQRTVCFRVDHRSEKVTGNVKQVWELSRMHHVTMLAAAFAFSGDPRYAEKAAAHLRSWWAENPFLSGVHWTSGIEIGMRLIAWVWTRRLLDGWPDAPALFERNGWTIAQIGWHQRYLAAFRSRGSSANNHAIAEAAGQLVASLAFPWFARSGRWASRATAVLERELAANTFPSGVNREQAFAYHGFVAELGLAAAAEADRAGQPLGEESWRILCRMLDVIAASVDDLLRGPRNGDDDEGRGLVLGPVEANRWSALLGCGRALFGAPDWWPDAQPDAMSILIAVLAQHRPMADRPTRRPSHFGDAGLTIMRTGAGEGPEIWCRCDGGPHGFLSIAGHAHADALAVEVRYGGTDILADPGTYCYHGEGRWREYFRSTLGHNTIEVGGVSQSTSGGAFLWTRHARTRLIELALERDGEVSAWSAEQDGYDSLRPPVSHRRTVRLLRHERRVEIADELRTEGHQHFCMAFHLGPDVNVELRQGGAELWWCEGDGRAVSAVLALPTTLAWRAVRGGTDPVLGWYSSRFGRRQPATTLLGEGTFTKDRALATSLRFPT